MSIQINQLMNNNFLLEVINKNVKIFHLAIQRVTMPSIRIDEALVNINPYVRAPLVGSNIQFEDLVVNIIIDEQFEVYKEIYKWMKSISDYLENECTDIVQDRELLIHVLDNRQLKPILTFRFIGVWPSSLNSFDFGYNDDNVQYLICPVMFKYKAFVVEKDGIILTKVTSNTMLSK